MQKFEIKTQLWGKDEIFKYLALGHTLGLPVLLIGPPGVGKTQILMDYISAIGIKTDPFVVELNYGTKPSEIKGRLDLKKYLNDHEVETDSPITDAEAILINEVDKGSSEIRNTLLSIMREKKLMLGHEVKDCNWKLFCASCNEIPPDEMDSPFWDRLIIKVYVNRIGKEHLLEVWDRQTQEIVVHLPDKKECDLEINKEVGEYLKLVYDEISDRTAFEIPLMTGAIRKIWNCSAWTALDILCQILTPHMYDEFMQKVINKDWIQVRSRLENINELTHIDDRTSTLLKCFKVIDGLDLPKDAIDELDNLLIEKYEQLKPWYENR